MIVSGELFQKIAQVSFYTDLNCIITDQNKSLEQNLKKISDTLPDSISNYKYIFIYTHFLDDFFNKFYDHLNNDTIIITHNSDCCIDKKYIPFLDNSKIKKWYCQNREIFHPKLISLPIGIANSQWLHGNQELIKIISNKNYSKSNLIFKNFDINTNSLQRNLCNNITNKNGIYMSPHMSIDKYWSNLATSFFSISPPGNGIDCHRIWESLYLKTVPIVIYHEAFSQFRHLPILFVSNWEEVTIQFLQSKVNDFKNVDWNIKELKINYWMERIQNDT